MVTLTKRSESGPVEIFRRKINKYISQKKVEVPIGIMYDDCYDNQGRLKM